MALSTNLRKPSRVGAIGIAVSLLVGVNTIHTSMEASRANQARERVQTKNLVNKHEQALERANQDQIKRSAPSNDRPELEPLENTLEDVPLVLHQKDANGRVRVR